MHSTVEGETPVANLGESISQAVASTSDESDSWRLWCRLCAKEDPNGNVNVFFKDEQQGTAGVITNSIGNMELSLTAAIEKYFWVNIKRNENLPEMLCTECFSLVTSLVNFTERVAKVQQMFSSFQTTSAQTKLDIHAVRLKYGLLDEDREHVIMQQPVPEVHYFEAKPKINELEEKMFETETEAGAANPLEQPHIKLKIKKEHLIEDDRGGLEDDDENDDAHGDDENEEIYEEDPFNSDYVEDCEAELDNDEDFQPSKAGVKESSSDEEQDDEEMCDTIRNIKAKLSDLQDNEEMRTLGKRRKEVLQIEEKFLSWLVPSQPPIDPQITEVLQELQHNIQHLQVQVNTVSKMQEEMTKSQPAQSQPGSASASDTPSYTKPVPLVNVDLVRLFNLKTTRRRDVVLKTF